MRHAGRLSGGALLLVIAVILVTGLITPGWLVTERYRTTVFAGSSVAHTGEPAAGLPASGAEAAALRRLADDYVAAFNRRDVPAIAALACVRPGAERLGLLGRTLRLGNQQATVSGRPTVAGDRASVPVTLSSTAKPFGRTAHRTEHSAVVALRRGASWCLR